MKLLQVNDQTASIQLFDVTNGKVIESFSLGGDLMQGCGQWRRADCGKQVILKPSVETGTQHRFRHQD